MMVLKQRVDGVKKKAAQPIKAGVVLEHTVLEVLRSKAVFKFKAVSNSPCHLERGCRVRHLLENF